MRDNLHKEGDKIMATEGNPGPPAETSSRQDRPLGHLDSGCGAGPRHPVRGVLEPSALLLRQQPEPVHHKPRPTPTQPCNLMLRERGLPDSRGRVRQSQGDTHRCA